MRKAYYTLDLTDAVLLKDHFLHNGVGAAVRNKGAVRIPYEGIASEVWVADDAGEHVVRELIDAYLEARRPRDGASATPWQCGHCREPVPGELAQCWNCGRESEQVHSV